MKSFLRAFQAVIMTVLTVLLSPWLGKPPDGKEWDH
jgi:hypothetical protein